MSDGFWAGFASPFIAVVILGLIATAVASVTEWVKKRREAYGSMSCHAICKRCGLTCVAEKPRRSRQMLTEHFDSWDCVDRIEEPCEIESDDDWGKCSRHNSWRNPLSQNCERKDAEAVRDAH